MEQGSALETLQKHGKSFRFAGMFLTQKQLDKAARLYQFCRWIDDIADETPDKSMAESQLLSIKEDLRYDTTAWPQLNDFLLLKRELHIPTILPIALIDGVLSDLTTVNIETTESLIRYAYRVAGTVGLMMCPILGADARGYPHAVDLGIGMQLTNIARDVIEDAQMGRRYIPYEWCSVMPDDIIENSRTTQALMQDAVIKLLSLSDRYYASGAAGYQYLPKKSRRAISVAAKVYQEIGFKLRENKLAYWQGRTVVSLPRKVVLACTVLFKQQNPAENKVINTHEKHLHAALEGLLPNWDTP